MADEEESPFAYDMSKGVITVAVSLRGSVIPLVLLRPEFWFLLFCNFGLTVAFERGLLVEHLYIKNALPGQLCKCLTGLMTFFLVFYTNNCFARYFKLYAYTRDMLGEIYAFVSEAKLRIMDRNHQRRAVRYLMGGVFAFFYEAMDGELGEEQLDRLKKRGLLTRADVEFLLNFPTENKSFVILHWSLEVALFGLGKGRENFLKMFQDKVYKVRRTQQDVVDTLKLPLPFQYFHFLTMLLVANLLVMSYTIALFQSYFATVMYLFAMIIFMGIREMATAMADPFGDDEVDFPVNDWLQEMFTTAHVILEYDYTVGNDANCSFVDPPSNEGVGPAIGQDQDQLNDFYNARTEMVETLQRMAGIGSNPWEPLKPASGPLHPDCTPAQAAAGAAQPGAVGNKVQAPKIDGGGGKIGGGIFGRLTKKKQS